MRILILLLVSCCVTIGVVPARADQVTVSVDQRMNVQSNPLRFSDGGPSDGTYSIRPGIRIADAGKRLNYEIKYVPTYEVYFRFGEARGWDQSLYARAVYNFSPGDRVSLSGHFTDYRAVSSDISGDVGADEGVDLVVSGRVKRFNVASDYSHSFTPRLNGRGGVTFEAYDFSQPNRVNSIGLVANASMRYLTLPKLVLGSGLNGSYRTFEALGTRPESDSATLNVSGIVESELTETISFALEAGPSLVFSRDRAADSAFLPLYRASGDPFDATGGFVRAFDPAAIGGNGACATLSGQPIMSGCEPVLTINPADLPFIIDSGDVLYLAGTNPGETSDTDLTYFMSASLSKRLDGGEIRVFYERREDVSVGLGPATVVDRLGMRAYWQPLEKWYGIVNFEWKDRASRNKQNIPEVVVSDSGTTIAGDPLSRNFALATNLIPNFQTNLVSQTTLSAGAHVTRQLTDRWTIGVIFRYVYHLANRTGRGEGRRYDNIVTSLQIQYEFEPFTF